MENGEKIAVEVAYALPVSQVIIPVKVNAEMSIEEIIKHSGILDSYPEIDLDNNKVGVFGKLSKLSSTLREGDRIEIYRPLIADPKEVRRQRAESGKKMKKGGGDVEESPTTG
jgi:hypothetical protein